MKKRIVMIVLALGALAGILVLAEKQIKKK